MIFLQWLYSFNKQCFNLFFKYMLCTEVKKKNYSREKALPELIYLTRWDSVKTIQHIVVKSKSFYLPWCIAHSKPVMVIYLTDKDTFCALLSIDKRIRKDFILDNESMPTIAGTRCAQERSLFLRAVGWGYHQGTNKQPWPHHSASASTVLAGSDLCNAAAFGKRWENGGWHGSQVC